MVVTDSGQAYVGESDSVSRGRDTRTPNGSFRQHSAKDLWRDVGLDLIDDARLQRRPIERCAALNDEAVEVPVPELVNQGDKIDMAVPVREGGYLAPRSRKGSVLVWVPLAGGYQGGDAARVGDDAGIEGCAQVGYSDRKSVV